MTTEFDINLHEKKIYSQNGEDGILEFIFSKIATTNMFSVEFGVGNGFECNTVYLLEKKGWKGLMMDIGSDRKILLKDVIRKTWSNKNLGFVYNIKKDLKFVKKILKQTKRSVNFQPNIKIEKITAENIQNLFQKYNVPKNFDLLSIDIDRTKKSLQGDLLTGDALMSYWKKERDIHEVMLKNMGAL